MEWMRDRLVHTVNPVTRVQIDTMVRGMGTAVVEDDLVAVADTARALRKVMAGLI